MIPPSLFVYIAVPVESLARVDSYGIDCRGLSNGNAIECRGYMLGLSFVSGGQFLAVKWGDYVVSLSGSACIIMACCILV